MPWLYLNKDGSGIPNAIEEITADSSDRAIGIVCGALVEDHLTTFLRTKMINDSQTIKAMFGMDMPLSNFGAKINLGFLMSLYSKEACEELRTIAKIRNKFAHKMETNSFNSAGVKDLCARLSLWEKIQIMIRKVSGKELLGSTMEIIFGENISKNEQRIFLAEPAIVGPEGYTAKYRYLNACRFFIAGFSILANKPHKMPRAAFQVRRKS
jgi:hypothetical protein